MADNKSCSLTGAHLSCRPEYHHSAPPISCYAGSLGCCRFCWSTGSNRCLKSGKKCKLVLVETFLPDLNTRVHVVVDVIVLQHTVSVVIEIHANLKQTSGGGAGERVTFERLWVVPAGLTGGTPPPVLASLHWLHVHLRAILRAFDLSYPL